MRTISRRRVLRTAALTTSAAALGPVPSGATAASTTSAMPAMPAGSRPFRIDTHHHAVPPAMRRWAVEQGLLPPEGGPRWGRWSLPETIETMERNRIAVGVASAPVPSLAFRDRAVAESGTRIINEDLADLVREHPSRFGFFAYLPLRHVDVALREAAHALDVLGADGVLLMTNDGARYLGDTAFDPLFAELDRRGAVVFTHPAPLPGQDFEVPGMDDWIGDFMLDTTRAAFNLVNSGTMDRHPRISVILSHAGGFLPYIGGRIEHAGRTGRGPRPEAFRRALRRFYYDTAAPPSPYATPTLLAAAGPGRLLYGTDWAQTTAAEVAATTRGLERDPALDERMRRAIHRGNALKLMPALARRISR
ncbi:amidohydrolase family protein [Spirillospora sp. NPDC047279]|uniref:amidohydrolase family protein n=1 Tax=Spirillospora sp. NPDC047279 TaxID=3155478 RepID=UPI0033DF55B5